MTLAACASLAPEAPQRVAEALPPAPAFMTPVSVPEPAGGQVCQAALANTRASLLLGNARLTESRGWYDKLRESVR